MQLAELNIAALTAPLESPEIFEFREFIPAVNALAENAPGFVWRLKGDESESSTDLATTPWDYDPRIIVNMSVWADLESLRNFTFTTAHSYFLRSRKKWFVHLPHPTTVLWWVADGHEPSLAEARARLDLLEKEGPTEGAFTFHRPFPAPADTGATVSAGRR